MNRSEIVALLRQPLYDAALGLTVAWPNVTDPGDAPRIDVAWTDPDRSDRHLALDGPVERGGLVLTAVTPADEGEDPGNVLADALAGAYPAGLRLTAPGLLIVLDRPATVRAGYRDGSEWRVPVAIPYSAYPST